MYKSIIISYDCGLQKVDRDYASDEIWDRLAFYFAFHGLDANGYDLRKFFEKAMTSLRNTKENTEGDVDIEDVFFKVFKKYKFSAKKKHIRELAVIFQILTTKKIEASKKMLKIIDFAKVKNLDCYIMANGQEHEVKNELNAMGLSGVFKKIYTSSMYGKNKPHPKMLKNLLDEEQLKLNKTLYITNSIDEVIMAKSLKLSAALLGEESKEADVAGDSEKIIEYIKN